MISTIIIICLMAFNLGTDLIQHGKPKEGKHNFYITFFSTLIILCLYTFAGLFDKFF